MPIDSSIYQSIKPAQFESPMNNLANVLKLQELQQGGQFNALKMQEAQRGIEQQNNLRSILSGVQTNERPDDVAGRLLRGGHLKEASDIQKSYRENQKNEAATAKDMADVVVKRTEWFKNALNGVRTPQDAAGWVQAQYKDQYLAPLFGSLGSSDDAIRKIPQDPAQFNEWMQTQALNMGKFIELNKPSIHMQNTGGNANVLAIPGLGGAPQTLSSTPITQSPDNAATIANSAEQARLSRGQSERHFQANKEQGQTVYDTERGMIVNKNTGLARPASVMNGESIEPKEKSLTEGQAKAILFGSRMENANKILGGLADKGTNAGVPFAGSGVMSGVLNPLLSENQQSLNQAKRDFVNATLRRESGATITTPEFDNAEKQYFPQVGDTPKVIKQKAENRATAIRGMKAEVPKAAQGKFKEVEGGGSPTKANASAIDKQAAEWANANPNDPRAAAIKQRLGL